MELDELKNIWEDANKPTTQQPILNPKMIEQMTQIKYKSRLRKVIYPELTGTIVSVAAVVYIALNFSKLTTPFFQGIGIVTILFLIVLPIISLTLLFQLNTIGDLSQPYAETLKKFATQKLRFIRFQQASVQAGYVLMVLTILLTPKFTGGSSLNENKYFWAVSIVFGYIFLYVFSRWVLGKYGKALHQAEELLKDLES
jgi:hypothetical protein